MVDDTTRDVLGLPARDRKPRARGRTMVLDAGLPTRAFEDLLESHGDLVDAVKFGWGTCLVTRDIKTKIDICRQADVDAYFGGTLFEKYAAHGALEAWRALAHATGITTVEVSNGTIVMSEPEKAAHVAAAAREFTVVSEVGVKDRARSLALTAEVWISAIRADLAAGASLVTLEARESGRSGFCTPDGVPRDDLLDAIAGCGVPQDRLLFEAPTRDLQVALLRRLGPHANLGNVAPADVVGLETLRLGLRADTFAGV